MTSQFVECPECPHDEHGSETCMPRRAKDDIFCNCTGPKSQPKPRGDLAAWQVKTDQILDEVALALDEQHLVYGALRLRDFRAHLAAMPAPPDVNAELLKALKGLVLAISEGNTYQPDWGEEGHRDPASCLISLKAQDQARDIIDVAEKRVNG